MKNFSLTLIAVIAVLQFTYGQWTINGSNIYNSNTGNVGIGATTPAQKLDVIGAVKATSFNVDGTTSVEIAALTGTGMGYSPTTYPVAAVGILSGSGVTSIGYNPLTNTGGNFTGDGSEVLFRNIVKFIQPNAGGTDYLSSTLTLNNGNVGIGTTSPSYNLDVAGVMHSQVAVGSNLLLSKSTGSSLAFDNGSGTQTAMIEAGTSDNHLEFFTNTASGTGIVERMRITNNGNLLIGQTSQVNTGYKLDVAGNVRANQVMVNTSGADFVFDPSYRLNSLSDIKKYIEQNHHLPEMPSAAQMQKEGLNVGDNQVKLLQKIEELTLYMIENDKKDKERQTELDGQKQKLLDQEKHIKLLEAKLDELLKKSH